MQAADEKIVAHKKKMKPEFMQDTRPRPELQSNSLLIR